MDHVRPRGRHQPVIPVASPHAQYAAHRVEIKQAIGRFLESGDYILGSQVEAFETAFANYCGVAYGVGVNSGSDAITLGLRALGVGPDDRVVTVSHTALATVAAVIATGATPVLLDIDPLSYTLDPNQLEVVMDERVKAVVPVHLYGNMADLSAICEVAERWDVPVVEDCAQATGAQFGERRAGSIGRVGCFSFYPTKNLGALGDGGMVVTDDPELAGHVTRLRQYGWDAKRIADYPGINSRLDELQAAVLMVKLAHLDADNERRSAIADRYSTAFADLPVVTPRTSPQVTHAFHLYVLATDARSELRKTLLEAGIQTAVHYPVPIHRQPGYADSVIVPEGGLPHTESVVERILSLPLYPELTELEVEKIIETVVSSFAQTESRTS